MAPFTLLALIGDSSWLALRPGEETYLEVVDDNAMKTVAKELPDSTPVSDAYVVENGVTRDALLGDLRGGFRTVYWKATGPEESSLLYKQNSLYKGAVFSADNLKEAAEMPAMAKDYEMPGLRKVLKLPGKRNTPVTSFPVTLNSMAVGGFRPFCEYLGLCQAMKPREKKAVAPSDSTSSGSDSPHAAKKAKKEATTFGGLFEYSRKKAERTLVHYKDVTFLTDLGSSIPSGTHLDTGVFFNTATGSISILLEDKAITCNAFAPGEVTEQPLPAKETSSSQQQPPSEDDSSVLLGEATQPY